MTPPPLNARFTREQLSFDHGGSRWHVRPDGSAWTAGAPYSLPDEPRVLALAARWWHWREGGLSDLAMIAEL